MKNWEIEPLHENKLDAVAELAQAYYGQDNDIADANYLHYEYFLNPAGKAVVYIAWDMQNQMAAGQYANVPIRLKSGNIEMTALMSGNILTGEQYRGQHIYPTLSEAVFDDDCLQGYPFVYGMPNQNSYPIQMKKKYFDDIGRIPLFLRPLEPSSMVRSYLKSNLLALLAKPFDVFFRLRMQENGEIIDLTSNCLNIADQFWTAVKEKYPVLVVRNGRFLNYRFLENPRRKYICRYFLHDGVPVACAIGRVMEVAGIQCGMIADFLYLPGHENDGKKLLLSVLMQLQKQGAAMAGCLMLPHTEEAHTLRKLGFFVCPNAMEPQPFRFCLHTFKNQSEEPDIMNLKNWFFTMSDYDVV